MTHFEFMQLSPGVQYQLMAMEGVQIAQRDDGLNKYFLYQLDSFYIEGKFHCNPHRLAGIRSFTSTMALESYLEKIDISSVV
jgi:hypothetical protein